MTQSKIISVLVFVSIMLCVWVLKQNFTVSNLSNQLGVTNGQLKKKDKAHEKSIDSLAVIIKKKESELVIAHQQTMLAQGERDIAHKQTQIANVKYERIKNSPVVHYTDQPKIDSVLSTLYPR